MSKRPSGKPAEWRPLALPSDITYLFSSRPDSLVQPSVGQHTSCTGPDRHRPRGRSDGAHGAAAAHPRSRRRRRHHRAPPDPPGRGAVSRGPAGRAHGWRSYFHPTARGCPGRCGRQRRRRPPDPGDPHPARQRLQVHTSARRGPTRGQQLHRLRPHHGRRYRSGRSPPEESQHIFERFYRGRAAGSTTGTGLGLAIAGWVVHQHGGRIDVAPSTDGARFVVTLPLAVA